MNGENLPEDVHAAPGDRADRPEAVGVEGVEVAQHDGLGERAEQRGDRGAGEHERDRVGPTSGRPDREDGSRGEPGADHGEPRVAGQRGDPEEVDADHDRERGAGLDPSSPGSASGLRVWPCIRAPATPRATPTAIARTVRGTRRPWMIVDASEPSGWRSTSMTVPSGMLRLPIARLSRPASTSSAARTARARAPSPVARLAPVARARRPTSVRSRPWTSFRWGQVSLTLVPRCGAVSPGCAMRGCGARRG